MTVHKLRFYSDVNTLLDWLDDHLEELDETKLTRANYKLHEVWHILERRKKP